MTSDVSQDEMCVSLGDWYYQYIILYIPNTNRHTINMTSGYTEGEICKILWSGHLAMSRKVHALYCSTGDTP